ncbi:MAG: dephospho-CoA kinase [Rikenellaceae bacterium]|nr:dephospho-CoA kinase [Rikenellaceae bacterium]
MIKVGLTGGIGSGKSTVSRIFGTLGIPVFDCDTVAKILLAHDSAVVNSVKELLGNDAYKDGVPDKKFIAGKIFQDSGLLSSMNEIVHPAVLKSYGMWTEKYGRHPYTVMESAILIESGFITKVDKTITVSAPEELRIHRVIERDKSGYDAVKQRIKAQINDAERENFADYIIIADEEHLVTPQILEIHTELLK